MIIGVPKEIKPQENRIGLTPESVKVLISEGHKVLIEDNGGFEAGFDNDQYIKAGAKIVKNAGDIFNDSEIIVKVKEPQKNEVDMIKENQIVYTYLHLAAAKELTEGLIKSKSINIAYETITDDQGPFLWILANRGAPAAPPLASFPLPCRARAPGGGGRG
jgi:Alanine dehydrogenase